MIMLRWTSLLAAVTEIAMRRVEDWQDGIVMQVRLATYWLHIPDLEEVYLLLSTGQAMGSSEQHG
jgi:hypothetical protein